MAISADRLRTILDKTQISLSYEAYFFLSNPMSLS